MTFWDTPAGRRGLAAWLADRADLRAAIDRESDERTDGLTANGPDPRVSGSAMTPAPVWTPRCRCGQPAERTLVLVWENIEGRRMRCCERHYDAMLDIIHNIRESAPDAVADLRVLVTS